MAAKSLKQLKSLASKADKLSTQEIDGFLKQLKRFLDTALEEVVGEMMDGNSDPALALGSLLDAIKKKGLKGELSELATTYGIISNGKLIEEITAEELAEKCRQYIDLKVDDTARAVILLERELGISDVEKFVIRDNYFPTKYYPLEVSL